MKKVLAILMVFCLCILSSCTEEVEETTATESEVAETIVTESTEAEKKETKASKEADKDVDGELMLAVAGSLETVFNNELIPMFNERYPGIKVTATFDSAGRLQAQIEEGAYADIFFSAAPKQMNDLNEKGFMDSDSIVNLLENKVVLVVPEGKTEGYEKFEDIAKAERIAMGDPEVTPLGQYAKKALENLELWEEVYPKISMGNNIAQVLGWVTEGSADIAVVFETDATRMVDKVDLVAEMPEGISDKAIYPVGIVKDCKNTEEAKFFMEFLCSDEAKQVFIDSGFTMVK